MIVILFVAIGQADFLVAYPALEMSPEKYDSTSVLFYNNDYSKFVCPFAKGTAQYNANCMLIPNYVNTDEMVDQSIMCKDTGCESEKLYSKK